PALSRSCVRICACVREVGVLQRCPNGVPEGQCWVILDVLRCFSVQILDRAVTSNETQLADLTGNQIDRRFSIAPMMDWTTRDYRYFARLLTKHALLYTEMVTTGAILHGDKARFLDYDAAEHPLAL